MPRVKRSRPDVGAWPCPDGGLAHWLLVPRVRGASLRPSLPCPLLLCVVPGSCPGGGLGPSRSHFPGDTPACRSCMWPVPTLSTSSVHTEAPPPPHALLLPGPLWGSHDLPLLVPVSALHQELLVSLRQGAMCRRQALIIPDGPCRTGSACHAHGRV